MERLCLVVTDTGTVTMLRESGEIYQGVLVIRLITSDTNVCLYGKANYLKHAKSAWRHENEQMWLDGTSMQILSR